MSLHDRNKRRLVLVNCHMVLELVLEQVSQIRPSAPQTLDCAYFIEQRLSWYSAHDAEGSLGHASADAYCRDRTPIPLPFPSSPPDPSVPGTRDLSFLMFPTRCRSLCYIHSRRYAANLAACVLRLLPASSKRHTLYTTSY